MFTVFCFGFSYVYYCMQNFYREIKHISPEREPEELPLSHEIFQCVYRLRRRSRKSPPSAPGGLARTSPGRTTAPARERSTSGGSSTTRAG